MDSEFLIYGVKKRKRARRGGEQVQQRLLEAGSKREGGEDPEQLVGFIEEPSQNDRSKRGLKKLSVKVRDMVIAKKKSSYKEVANDLIRELSAAHFPRDSSEESDKVRAKISFENLRIKRITL